MTNRMTYHCAIQPDGTVVCTPVKEGRNARRSAAACSPDDLRVRDADAVEVFVTDYEGQRYSGSNFANVESAKAWIALQPNRASLRVAMTAKFILENEKSEQPERSAPDA